jgi:hypothetical protein
MGTITTCDEFGPIQVPNPDYKPMTRAKFISLTGEDPVDILGPDWRNLIDSYIQSEPPYEENGHFHEGHQVGGCFTCKMD